jgi:hypothetical protein
MARGVLAQLTSFGQWRANLGMRMYAELSPDTVSVIQVRSTGRVDCSIIGRSAVHKPVPTMLSVNIIFPPYFWMRNPAGI